MWFQSWFDILRIGTQPRRSRSVSRPGNRRRQRARRLLVEGLEDRRLLTFMSPVDYAVGRTPFDVATADFTNDGRPDLAVVNYSDSTVGVLVASDTVAGTFNPMLTSPTGANPRSLAVGDFNEDGNMDVATIDGNGVSVLLGDGAGALAPAPTSTIGLGSAPQSVAVGDFNGDGKLDLGVTSNTYNNFDDYY